MKLIVGIGNPGREYKRTRHNLGFAVVDALAERWDVGRMKRRFQSRVGEAHFAGDRVMLVKPQTYVNESGKAVMAAVHWRKIDLADILIVVDDFNLSVGRVKINAAGSAGGHNGMASIIQVLGTRDVPRIRLGIGDDAGRCDRDFVLSTFREDELPAVKEMMETAVDAVETWMRDGIEHCMSQFNRKPARAENADHKEDSP